MFEEFDEFQRFYRSVDRHRLCSAERLDRHRRACRRAGYFGLPGMEEVSRRLMHRIRDEWNLECAYRHVKATSGKTWGGDGLTADDLKKFNCEFDFIRQIRDEIDAGEYHPQPNRLIYIPKASGTGVRPIQIPTLWDRTVQRAVVQIIGPPLDTTFGPRSYGGRRELSRLDALADMEEQLRSGRRVIVSEDIKDCFEHVPQGRVLQIASKRLRLGLTEVKRGPKNRPIYETLPSLLRKLVRTDRGHGLAQGAASSPLFLNLYADHHLDRPWVARFEAPLLRYIDDLLVACATDDEARECREELMRLLLPTGLSLKDPPPGQSTIHKLDAGDSVDWLGFRIRWRAPEMQVLFTDRAWERWDFKMWKASTASDSCEVQTRGSIREWGPAYPFEDRRRCHERIMAMAAKHRLRTIPFVEFENVWAEAFNYWLVVRERRVTRGPALSASNGRASTCAPVDVQRLGRRLLKVGRQS